MKNKSKVFVLLTLLLCFAQIMVLVGSLVIGAVWPSLGLHSLLSGAGLRCILSAYADDILSPFFVYLLCAAITAGTYAKSEVNASIAHYKQCGYNEQLGVRIFFGIAAIGIAACLAMAFYPHSSFLGISGKLFPGPFLRAAYLVLCMSVVCGAVSYYHIADKMKTYEDAEQLATYGLRQSAPLVIIYFLAKELWSMLCFVVQ